MDLHKAAIRGASEPLVGRKLFTLDRAVRALPLVRRIVADVVKHYQRLLAIQKEYQSAVGLGPSDVLEGIRDQRQQLMDRLNEFSDELHAVGCELKDYEVGLVDFPSVMDGREIYLCWKLGDETIGHWHEVYTGFASRQPLPHM